MTKERDYGLTPPEGEKGGLSDAEKARIREEEAFRAQARAEAEASVAPKSKKELEAARKAEAKRQQEERLAEIQRKDAERRAALTPEARAKEDRRNLVMGLALVLFLIGGTFACNMRWQAAPPKVSGPKPIEQFDKYDVMGNCEASVKRKLKAPATAKFEDGSDPVFSEGQWTYTGYVDAENSFGATLRSTYACTITGTNYDDANIQTVLLE